MEDAKQSSHTHDRGFRVRESLADWLQRNENKLTFKWPRSKSGELSRSVNLEALLELLQVRIEDQQALIERNERFIEGVQGSGPPPHSHHTHVAGAHESSDTPDVPPLGPTTAELFEECCRAHPDSNSECLHREPLR